MPRGGLRAGAGRPPSSGKKTSAPKPAKATFDAAKASDGAEGQLDPLAYMLKVMNDDQADDTRRDRMAVAAAVYLHGKPGDAGQGVKKQRQEAGLRAATGGGRFASPPPPGLPRVVQ